MNNANFLGANLGSFGWNFSSIADIRISTDSNNNVFINNAGIESTLPSQRTGTALYNTPDPQNPLDELLEDPYSLDK